MKISSSNRALFWGFLTPVLISFIIVVIIPFALGIYYSFTYWKAIPGEPVIFTGFNNFQEIFKDDIFFQSFRATLFYTFYSVVLINIIGFFLALLVTQKFRTANLLRTTFFMPLLIGGLLLGYIWKFIFIKISPALFEIINSNGPNWLGDVNWALFAMAIVGTWQMAGYIMVIYIAALQGIPQEILEAAAIDGASTWSKIRHITFPLVAHAFTVNMFLTLAYSFKQFDTNFSLTAGNPAGQTELLALNIYTTAFSKQDFGGGQAKSLIFFLLVAAITLIQVYFSKKREVEM